MLNRRPRCGERGAVLVFVAPLFLAIFAITALVVDIGNARQESRHTQGSVDAAALAAARELPLDKANAARAGSAKQQAAKNLNINLNGSSVIPASTPCSGTVPANSTCYSIGDIDAVVATPYLDGPASAPKSYGLVYVRACQPTATFFASTIGASSPTVCREAIGRRQNVSGGFGMGLVVIDPTACKALQFSGSSDTVLSSNGAVMVNSECSTNALDATGTSWTLEASYIGVVGKAALAPCDPLVSDKCTDTVPTEGIDHFDDPFGHLSPPSPIPANSGTHNCSPSAGTRVLQPGRYPTSCSFNNNDGYVLRPGVYYFDNGFSTNGNAELVCHNTANNLVEVGSMPPPSGTCDGVTFIVAGGGVSMNGTADLHLPPPTTGPYAGVTLYQTSSASSTINGTANFYMGTVYAPNAFYKFTGSGGGSSKVNIHGMVVTKTAEITGSFYFNIFVPEGSPEALEEDDFGLWK